MASFAPGVKTTCSPSMSGDSEKPQSDIICPFHSGPNSFCHTIFPSVVRQAIRPSDVTT